MRRGHGDEGWSLGLATKVRLLSRPVTPSVLSAGPTSKCCSLLLQHLLTAAAAARRSAVVCTPALMSTTTTGVLPFLRGIDLSRNDLQVSTFAATC